jgi:hypothetical protein
LFVISVGAFAQLGQSVFSPRAPLPSPLVGSSGFTEQFESRPPTDSEGRSLRHFDLNERLMRYPLS